MDLLTLANVIIAMFNLFCLMAISSSLRKLIKLQTQTRDTAFTISQQIAATRQNH